MGVVKSPPRDITGDAEWRRTWRVSREKDGAYKSVGRRLPAAQELTVARAHEGATTLHQPNGPVTQRGRLPRLPLEASRAEQHLGYFAIRSFRKVAIDCT